MSRYKKQVGLRLPIHTDGGITVSENPVVNSKCITTRKVAYTTEEEAEVWIKKHNKSGLRIYYCIICDHYHITKRINKWKNHDKRKRGRKRRSERRKWS